MNKEYYYPTQVYFTDLVVTANMNARITPPYLQVAATGFDRPGANQHAPDRGLAQPHRYAYKKGIQFVDRRDIRVHARSL